MGFFRRKRVIAAIALLLASGIAGAILIPPVVFRQKVKQTMEAALKTQVDVGSAEVSLSLKSGTVYDLVIHNPEGYEHRPFLIIPKVTFELDSSVHGDGITQVKSLVLHDPVMYLETSGETSNLKDIMALLKIPSEKPVPPTRIALLRISNGIISSYPDASGQQPPSSPFPVEEIHNLEGRPGQIANRIAKELQESMDKQVKETVKSLKEDIIKGFSELFGL